MIYSELVKSKDDLDIPVFLNGRTMHSKYDPLKEASSFGNELNQDSKFTVIVGLGGGYHIDHFADKYPDNFIVAVENSDEDIAFLSKIECVKKISAYENVKIIAAKDIFETILKNYLPQFYGGINILFNRAWHDANPEASKKITDDINAALKMCSRDYSVQCHFGLIWQKNILKNLKVLSELRGKKIFIDARKTAAVIAAGPSLDKTIDVLKKNRDSYYIIATDTAYSVIESNGMTCDAVVSIDGQNISHKHFIGRNNSETVFVFDLQANGSAVNYVKNFTDNIIFTKSGHPFCEYASLNGVTEGKFLSLESGAGTVTIAAADFALKCGFSKIEVFGADFSYLFNKPYAKGTYLDCLYRMKEDKKTNAEKKFTDLIYRTPVRKIKSELMQIKNDVLDSYRDTFIEWIKNHGLKFDYTNLVYSICSENKKNDCPFTFENPAFDYEKFLRVLGVNSAEIIEKLSGQESKTVTAAQIALNPDNLTVALLPLTSYLRANDKKLTFISGIKLALSKILEYT